MADYNSSLPVRTETNGDVAVKVVDGTITSQTMTVNSDGSVNVRNEDGAGNLLTSQVNGSQRALDVGIDVAGVQIDPRQVRALTSSDTVTVVQPSGANLHVNVDNFPADADAYAQGSTTSGQLGSLVLGAVTTNAPAYVSTQSNALSLDTSGLLRVSLKDSPANTNKFLVTADPITFASPQHVIVDSGTLSVTQGTSPWVVRSTNFPTTVDTNYGTVGANTLRVASQIGNATGAADYNNGATGAQTLRVAANLAIGGADVTAANPVPVTIEDAPGTHINDFKDAASIAAGALDNHDYTVTAGKTLHLNQIEASASGKARMQISVETGVATGVFTIRFVRFNSTAAPDMSVILQNSILVAAGVRVRVVMSNTDKAAQDLYSTICGYEI